MISPTLPSYGKSDASCVQPRASRAVLPVAHGFRGEHDRNRGLLCGDRGVSLGGNAREESRSVASGLGQYGPWQNAKGAVIATSVADLHSENTKMGKAIALDEMGRPIKVRGDSPVMHDILTGSDKNGRAFPPNMDLTCN